MDTYIFLFLVGFFSSMIVLTTIQIVYGIYEDQFIVCNFEDKCLTIDIDDYINREKSDLLWDLLNNDIDTYSIGDLN